MATPPQPPSNPGDGLRGPGRLKYDGLLKTAKKNKASYIQFFIMTGILFASLRSLGQKYRIHELTEETFNLRQEQESLNSRVDYIKRSLRAEAAAEPTGAFAARLRLLIGDE